MGRYVFRLLVVAGLFYIAAQSWLLALVALFVAAGLFGRGVESMDVDDRGAVPDEGQDGWALDREAKDFFNEDLDHNGDLYGTFTPIDDIK